MWYQFEYLERISTRSPKQAERTNIRLVVAKIFHPTIPFFCAVRWVIVVVWFDYHHHIGGPTTLNV